ncbi:class I SAM-dependent RNA methyltransferase [Elusimicrobiota bacterium]
MICKHFGKCGGCSLQDIPYKKQLLCKTKLARKQIKSFWKKPVKIIPSPDIYYYRNKVELSFGGLYPPRRGGGVKKKNLSGHREEGKVLLGFKEKGKWYKVINIRECLIFDPLIRQITKTIKDWAEKNSLKPYNSKKHVGFLRYLVIRKTRSEMIIMLVTTSERKLPKHSLVKTIARISPMRNLKRSRETPHLNPTLRVPTASTGISINMEACPPQGGRKFKNIYQPPNPQPQISVLHGIQDMHADVAYPQKVKVLLGQDHMTEDMLGMGFRYNMESFFQTNPKAFGTLAKDLLARAKKISPKRVLDLYCGAGIFTLLIKKELQCKTIGIESHMPSLKDAAFNRNNLIEEEARAKNPVSFCAAKVERLATKILSSRKTRNSLVILDPPRGGIHPKVRKAIAQYPPKYLFYVSCNPKLFLRDDMPAFIERYNIEDIRIYDFFPHTEHFEMLVCLKRK